jgi:hypothetical protein
MNQLNEAQKYFQTWASHRAMHATSEDQEVVEQFFAAWRDKAISGAIKGAPQEQPPP